MATEAQNRKILDDLEPGAAVILEKKDGTEVTGTITVFDDDGVTLADQEAPIDLSDVDRVMLPGLTLDS